MAEKKKKAAGNATSTVAKKNNSASIIAEPIDIVNMTAEEIIAAAIGRLEKAARQAFSEHYDARKRFEYENGDLLLRQPESMDEIVHEGKALAHCVGGYAERHAKGITNILFIRKKSEPDKPYYTVEVDNSGVIRQCYGYKNNKANNPKPPEIKAFEEHYQQYLSEVFHGKQVKSAVRQGAGAA